MVNGQRRLWNPFSAKSLAYRPEEQVRLQVADALVLEGHFPASRLAFESGVRGTMKLSTLRTDLVVYAADMTPFLLVECKQPGVALTEETLRQALIYNDVLQAPHIWLTNGSDDVFYSGTKAIEDPDWLKPAKAPVRDSLYWKNRGFLPEKASAEQLDWLQKWFSGGVFFPTQVYTNDGRTSVPHVGRATENEKAAVLSTFWPGSELELNWQAAVFKNRKLFAFADAKIDPDGTFARLSLLQNGTRRSLDFANLILPAPESPLSFDYQEFVLQLTENFF